jgi:hypothetical protein
VSGKIVLEVAKCVKKSCLESFMLAFVLYAYFALWFFYVK